MTKVRNFTLFLYREGVLFPLVFFLIFSLSLVLYSLNMICLAVWYFLKSVSFVFLVFYLFLVSLNVLSLLLLLECSQTISSNINFAPLSLLLWYSSYKYATHFSVPQFSDVLFLFFSLHSSLGSFYWSIFKFTDFFPWLCWVYKWAIEDMFYFC